MAAAHLIPAHEGGRERWKRNLEDRKATDTAGLSPFLFLPFPLEDVVPVRPGLTGRPRDLPPAVRQLDASSQIVSGLAVGLDKRGALGSPGIGEDHADPEGSCRVLDEG